MGSEDLYMCASFTKSRLLQDTGSMKMSFTGENADLDYPPPHLGNLLLELLSRPNARGRRKSMV